MKIVTTSSEIAKAYFEGKISGCVKAPEGFSSEGRKVSFIKISKGAHRVTLSGYTAGSKWEETYQSNAVTIDD